jgi:hypothetical protein
MMLLLRSSQATMGGIADSVKPTTPYRTEPRNADRPDLFEPERRFLSDELALVPWFS